MPVHEPGPETWDKFWSQKQDLSHVYPSSPSVLKTIRENIILQGKNVLEVGAGTGRDSVELSLDGAYVTVLDYSKESLGLIGGLKKQVQSNITIELVRGDAFGSPFKADSFDLVFHQGLLEHFLNPLDLLKENHRILKPGGYCLCDIPQTFHLYTVAKKILIALDKWFAGWETQYTMPELEQMMRQAGFTPVVKYGDWMRPSFLYRVLREISIKVKLELPKYPFQNTRWYSYKENLLDRLAKLPYAHYTQLSIGILAQKN
jgi:SAM-dependent methyltransferase